MPYQIKDLYTKTTAEKALAIASIPAGEAELDLSDNALGVSNELDKVFIKAFPMSVTSVNLSNNGFGVSPAKLALICEALSPATIFVDLRGNALGSINPRRGEQHTIDLARIFKALANVTTLRLDDNCLQFLIPAELISKYLKNSLSGVETIYLSYYEIVRMSAEQRHAFKEIFPTIKKVILTDDYGNEINYTTFPLAAAYARSLGDKTRPLSLLAQCAFFAVKHNLVTEANKTTLTQPVNDYTDNLSDYLSNPIKGLEYNNYSSSQ